jgi:hypothetical protein
MNANRNSKFEGTTYMAICEKLRNIKRAASGALIASVVVGFVICGLNSTAKAQAEASAAIAGSRAPIEGSWIFSVTPPGGHFTALVSFTAGGVFLATGSNDRLNSPLHGSWKRTRWNRYDSTTYFFTFDSANPFGPAVGMLKTNEVFHLKNRDELVGVGDLFSCNLEGQNCVSVPDANFKTSAKRIVPEKDLSASGAE